MSRAPNAERGFTLLELMVVMVLLGLMAGLAYPRLFGRGPSLEQATQVLVKDLRRAREEALAEGRARVLDLEALAAGLPAGFHLQGEGMPLVFLPNGAASGALLRLEGKGDARLVEVDWLTGRIDRRGP